MGRQQSKTLSAVMVLLSSLWGAGCYNLSRLENAGEKPPLNPIKDPTKLPSYHPVTMPMPAATNPAAEGPHMNSLWRPGARGFFKDQRAKKEGDILTVKVNISGETFDMSATMKRERKSHQATAVNKLMGYEKYAPKVLPLGFDLTDLVNLDSNSKYESDPAQTTRTDTVTVTIAATITQILPNGNLVVSGRQEVRGGAEVREIFLTGIVRPEDVSSANTVDAQKIAELRMSYGGRGQISDFAQVPYGQEIIDLISPF